MDIKLLPLYFLLGGTLVTLVSYFGAQGRGILAAFIALLPTITVITLCTIYLGSGVDAATSYFKGLLILIPVSWLPYVIAVIYLLPRLGLVPALSIGISLYLAGGFVVMKLVH